MIVRGKVPPQHARAIFGGAMRGAKTTEVMARWIAGVVLASILAAGVAAGGRPAAAQGGPLPADVGTAIEAAIRAGDAAAANAAVGAQISRHPTPGEVVERARSEVVEAKTESKVKPPDFSFPGLTRP